jgi:hypothetical protein
MMVLWNGNRSQTLALLSMFNTIFPFCLTPAKER